MMENYNTGRLLSYRNVSYRNVSYRRGKDYCVEYRKNGPSFKEKLIAEKVLLRRIYTGLRTVQECPITNTRAKFLIVFSPDGTKLASTNGNHNVYLIDVRTKKILKTLIGHKRTPWTVAFHPTNNNILASGCLSGEVRVWNLEDNSCETWQSPGQTVIASLAFHPKVKLLVIATYRDIYFWDWNTSILLGQTSTENEEEKIRYVKFDSSGDKLITAIALSSKLLSQFDSISLREVFHFTRERAMLEDLQLIEKHCDRQILKLKEVIRESKRESDGGRSKEESDRKYRPTVIGNGSVFDMLPYLCTSHRDAIHSALNVDCFCPTEFSNKFIDTLKTSRSPPDYITDKCYICRYMWLYKAIFEFKLINGSKYHICTDFRFMMNDKHNWKFDDRRLHVLKNENEDPANGLTEETVRYCFENYARLRIVPFFHRRLPNGICSKAIEYNVREKVLFKNSGLRDFKKPFAHNVTLRSDCFLNVCEMFQFNPSGIFSSFLTAFAELYQYLPAVQQISTKEDELILNNLITEWEYLYCKLLLINKIIDGDDAIMMNKQSVSSVNENDDRSAKNTNPGGKKTNSQTNHQLDSTAVNLSNDLNRETKINSENFIEKKKKIENENDNASPEENDCDSKGKPHQECDLCKIFDKDWELSNRNAMKLLHIDLENVSTAILRRYEPKTQRSRMEKLYRKQFDSEINRKDGALFRTLQTTKKSVRMYLSSVLTELKKLLKIHWPPLLAKKSAFGSIIFRMFLFVTRKTITFIGQMLEFLCNFRYEINELAKIDSMKIASSTPLFSMLPLPLRPYRFLDNLPHRRDYTFEINSNDEPVFDEEVESASSDLSDDELSSSLSDQIFSGNERWSAHSPSRNEIQGLSIPRSSSSNPLVLNSMMPSISSRRITVSSRYLQKHLQFFDLITDRWPRGSFSPDSYQLVLLQNVNSLFNHFLSNSVELNSEYRNNSHPLHRLQMWDFSKLQIPDISSKIQNVVVTECKVHNDATIAISTDDHRIAVLLSPNQYDQPDWLGVFSLEWKTLGQILCAVSLNQIAVSLSFSPTDRYLAVGYSFSYSENIKMADIISVQQETEKWRNLKKFWRRRSVATSLIDISRSDRIGTVTTVNCITWIPVPGQGLVFGNSVGELKFVT